MMSNLFSVFDPSGVVLSNWVSFGFVFFFLIWVKGSGMNRIYGFVNRVFSFISQEYFELTGKNKGYILGVIVPWFWVILSINFLGLLPYIFTCSSHLSFTMSVALSLWLGSILNKVYVNLKGLLSHMTPQGTPMVLIPLMVVIETVSNIIRPLTLSVRLAANMIAGHLLLVLLSSSMLSLSYSLTGLVLVLQSLLLILESAVAIIQSYVFITLMVLYLVE